MRVSVLQMNPGANKSDNIAQARHLIQNAVEQDRPELFLQFSAEPTADRYAKSHLGAGPDLGGEELIDPVADDAVRLPAADLHQGPGPGRGRADRPE